MNFKKIQSHSVWSEWKVLNPHATLHIIQTETCRKRNEIFNLLQLKNKYDLNCFRSFFAIREPQQSWRLFSWPTEYQNRCQETKDNQPIKSGHRTNNLLFQLAKSRRYVFWKANGPLQQLLVK